VEKKSFKSGKRRLRRKCPGIRVPGSSTIFRLVIKVRSTVSVLNKKYTRARSLERYWDGCGEAYVRLHTEGACDLAARTFEFRQRMRRGVWVCVRESGGTKYLSEPGEVTCNLTSKAESIIRKTKTQHSHQGESRD
jgi:hypothetical protein